MMSERKEENRWPVRFFIVLATVLISMEQLVWAETPLQSPAAVERQAAEGVPELSGLHALSVALMDADSGRILYEKEGDTPRPMASTTKIMTCILALEHGAGDDYVQVSANAAMQPEVRLGMQVGEQYYLEDLLYSLMLKSHNDTAVAIAEAIGGSVEGFADMMNEKAREIGCRDTYFITPNGLDAEDENGIHHSTARDLCLMMRYAIKKDAYLKITAARSHTFHDISGHRTFTVTNANALLDMNEKVLTGKTGYTGKAGYCYVCTCRSQDRTFLIALLGCGWPHNKTWKWQDTQQILNYAEKTFFLRSFPEKLPALPTLSVSKGADPSSGLWEEPELLPVYRLPSNYQNKKLLLKESDSLKWKTELPKALKAPVEKNEQLGHLILLLNGKKIKQYPILAGTTVPKSSFSWVLEELSDLYFH